VHYLIIVENLPVPADYRVWLIATTLRDHGFEVSVICPATKKYPAGKHVIDGINVYRHSLPIEAGKLYQYIFEYVIALWKEFWLTVKIFRKNKFNVIHACNPPDLIWIIGLFWKVFGVKFVFDHHDLSPELLLTKLNANDTKSLKVFQKLVYKILRLMEFFSQRAASIVLTTNESFKKIAVTRNNCNPERVFTVRTGPKSSEQLTVNSEQPAHRSLGVGGKIEDRRRTTDYGLRTKDIPRLGYVGVMAGQDGVDGLLRICHYLKTGFGKTFELVLLGDGPEFEKLKKLASELELGRCANFPGFVSQEKVKEELSKCDIGITPDPSSPMNDYSTMLKVMDYMSHGLPQVMYDLAENKATAGNAALYASPGNEKEFAEKLAELIDDEELRRELGRTARERIKSLAWEKCGAPALLKAVEKLK